MSHVRAAVYYKQKYMKLLEEETDRLKSLWGYGDLEEIRLVKQRISIFETVVRDIDNIIGD